MPAVLQQPLTVLVCRACDEPMCLTSSSAFCAQCGTELPDVTAAQRRDQFRFYFLARSFGEIMAPGPLPQGPRRQSVASRPNRPAA